MGPGAGRATDDELLAMIARPQDWSDEALEDAQRELARRGVPFTPPPPPEQPTPVGWPLWAIGTAVLTVMSVLVISNGWGPRASAVFVLPAALCLGMTIRRLMGR